MKTTLSAARGSQSGGASEPPPWLDRTLYPFRARRYQTEEGTIHYVDEGRGRPVLFVHGTPSWSFEWRHAVASLSATHRCVAPDHLGFGLSDKPPGASYTPRDHAGRLRGLVRRLDLEDITLVVHDFGGPIGLSVALDEPARFASVVVLNTWMWAHGVDPRVRRLSSFVASPLGRFLYVRLNASPRWLLPMSFGDRRKLGARAHRHYLAPFAQPSDRLGAWTLGRELAGSDAFYDSLWTRRVQLRDLPLSLLWATKDPAFTDDYLARWREAFPGADLTLIEGAGHFPQEEAPAQVTAGIRAALERQA